MAQNCSEVNATFYPCSYRRERIDHASAVYRVHVKAGCGEGADICSQCMGRLLTTLVEAGWFDSRVSAIELIDQG